MTEIYHIPALADESIEGLNINPDGIYVDLTFGGGGHSRLILEQLSPQGVLFSFDQDADARANLTATTLWRATSAFCVRSCACAV